MCMSVARVNKGENTAWKMQISEGKKHRGNKNDLL